MNLATLLCQRKTKKGHKSRSFWSEMLPGGPNFRLGDQEKNISKDAFKKSLSIILVKTF